MFYVYIVRCADNTLYCGQTINVEKRIAEHNSSTRKAAKYIRGKKPVQLVYIEKFKSRGEAMRREIEIKKMKKVKKEALLTR